MIKVILLLYSKYANILTYCFDTYRKAKAPAESISRGFVEGAFLQ